jgi:hypothetical protein
MLETAIPRLSFVTQDGRTGKFLLLEERCERAVTGGLLQSIRLVSCDSQSDWWAVTVSQTGRDDSQSDLADVTVSQIGMGYPRL